MFRRHSYPSERAQTFQNIPGSFLITKPEPFHARDLVQHLKHFIYHGKRTYPLNIAEVTPFHDEKVIKDHFNVIDVAISDILGQVAVTVSRLKTYEQSLLGQPSQKKKIGGGRGWCRVVVLSSPRRLCCIAGTDFGTEVDKGRQHRGSSPHLWPRRSHPRSRHGMPRR